MCALLVAEGLLCFFRTHKLRMEVEVDLSVNDLGGVQGHWTGLGGLMWLNLCACQCAELGGISIAVWKEVH